MVPLKFVLNFEPELVIGLVYKANIRDKKKRIYIIEIGKLFLLKDPEKIANALLQKHSEYLDKSIIPYKKFVNFINNMLLIIFKEFNYDEDHSIEPNANFNNISSDEDIRANNNGMSDFRKEIENLKNQKTDHIDLDKLKNKKGYRI